MELRSGWGGAAAILAILVTGSLASSRLTDQPAPDVRPETATQAAPSGTADVERGSSEEGSADSLDRPVNEIRTFFGYPRTRQPALDEKTSELLKEIQTCFHCRGPEKLSARISKLSEEIRRMAKTRGYELRFLVALVPDPSGSYVGRQFDTYATALLRGATASGWLPDRHWFPWRDIDSAEAPGNEPRAQSGSRYTPSPGIVLFRRNSSDRILLTVFLVGESPHTGVHKRAFVDTLRLISSINSSINPGEKVQVLGPFSSGAARSCSLALEEWYSRKDIPRANAISFLSGSATNPDVGERLKPRCEDCSSLKVTFRRTVASDASLQEAGFKFFEEELGWYPNEIAILAESDSSYGQNLQNQTQEPRKRHWRLLLPVPSALSSVRTASERSRKAEEIEVGGVRVPASGLELKLDETRVLRDTFPVFDPMTAPLNEIELDSLLSTLAREKIRHLGLVFTDVRDRLFVAAKVKEYAPHVSIFTFESSMLYVHPRVNPNTDGMLVVSSYPLSMVTQQLMGGLRGSGVPRRVQFGSDPEQGFYNATVIALAERGRTPPVADYLTIPGTAYRAPAVWISSVGDGRLVPLAAVRPYAKSDLPAYLGETASDPSGSPLPDSVPPELQRLIRRLGVPSGFRFCFWIASVVFALLSLSLVLGYSKSETRTSRRLAGVLRPLMRPDHGEDRQQKRWIVALIAVLSASWMALATVYVVPFLLRERSQLHFEIEFYLKHGDWIATLEEFVLPPLTKVLPLIGLLLVVLLARLGWILDRSDERRRPIFAVFLGATMAVALILSQRALSSFRPEQYIELDRAVFTYLRAAAGAASLSPLVGILFLASGFSLLVFFQIKRLRIRDDWRCRMPVESLSQSRDVPLRSLNRPQKLLDRRIREAIPTSLSFWASFLVLLGPLLVAFFFRFEASSDSFVWSKTFAALFAFVLLPASLAAFYRFVTLWRALRRIIVRQEWSSLVSAFQTSQQKLDWQPLKTWGSGEKRNYATLIGSVELLRRLSERAERPRVTVALGELLGHEQAHLRDLAQNASGALAETLEANAKGQFEAERAARLRVLNALDTASQHVQLMLNRVESPGADAADPDFRKELTDYLALRAIAYIRYVFAEIHNSLLAFTVGILFLLAGLASFHFQPLRSVYVVLWSVIGVVAIWTVMIFIEMDRNTVMSKIGGTNPGELNPIKSGLFLRIGAFVVPPVVGLLVTQFPQFGRPFLNWLNPLLRVFQ